MSKGTVTWKCRDRLLELESRALIMGIVNVTPDSFSDGGEYFNTDAAVHRALEMIDQGADIIDIGGESTRPGASPTKPSQELARILPVIEALSRQHDNLISIDTQKAEVADKALAAGASIINDVSALSQDPGMLKVAARYDAGVILMHMRGEPRTMQADPQYDDVVNDVSDYLKERIEICVQAGLERDTLAVDPGIGFGKTLEHNLALLANLKILAAAGRPVVVGLSRKSFLGKITGRETDQRLAGSLAGLAYSVLQGAHIMRVHDVAESADVAAVLTAIAGEARDVVA